MKFIFGDLDYSIDFDNYNTIRDLINICENESSNVCHYEIMDMSYTMFDYEYDGQVLGMSYYGSNFDGEWTREYYAHGLNKPACLDKVVDIIFFSATADDYGNFSVTLRVKQRKG